jgi:acetyl esterase/lipase
VWLLSFLSVVEAVFAESSASEVIELFGATPDKPILCSVYRPEPPPEVGKAGLVIHLYGHHGTHLEHNAGRKPFEELRKLLVERGYWLVVPNLGLSHWMNDEAVENVDRVIDQMVSKYGVDPKQVNLLGSSMGGGGSLVYVTRDPRLPEGRTHRSD